MELDTIRKMYEQRKEVYGRLREESLFILRPLVSKAGIRTHSVDGRVKELESVLDKNERKEYINPFEQMTDIVGLRVVCLFISSIAKVGDLIRSEFDVLSEDDKIEGGDAASFGYMSVHFIVKLPKSYKGPRYDDLIGISFEIQVRTLAMDAWATISHYLSYKNDQDIPKELRRDFYALSGLFYVADTHFEMFFKSRAESLRKR